MKSKGFTLIELLVVISIIGVIASIVLVSFSGSRDKAKLARSQQFSSQINHALGAYAVGIWDFEDQNNPTADRSGYGNNGTLYDNTNFVDNDVLGGHALIFDGSGDYVDCENNASLKPGSEITIEAWFKLSTVSGTNTILSKDSPGPTNYWIDIRSNGTVIYVGGYTSAGGACYQSTSVSTISTDTWYHLVWTYNRERMITYINGISVRDMPKTCILNANDAPVRIGTRNGTGGMFNGSIDDVRIYNEALSASQIQQHYAQGAVKHGIALK